MGYTTLKLAADWTIPHCMSFIICVRIFIVIFQTPHAITTASWGRPVYKTRSFLYPSLLIPLLEAPWSTSPTMPVSLTYISFINIIILIINHSFPAGDLLATPTDGTQVLYNLGDMSFMICSMALVWIMIPGVGFFYSGLLRRKNALSMIYISMASVAVVSFQVRLLLPIHR